MNTMTLNADERFLTRMPAARRPAAAPSLFETALRNAAVIGMLFAAATAAMSLRVLAAAHTFPGFHDALAHVLPFLD